MKRFLKGLGKSLLRLGPVGGEVLVVLILLCGWFFPYSTAAVVDFQPAVMKVLAGWFSYLPWWLGGGFGSVLWGIASFHDVVIQTLVDLANLPSLALTAISSYIPDVVTNFVRNIGGTTFAWARIIFGAALIYIEYRVGRLLWVIAKVFVVPMVWVYREDKKDHLQSPHPMYNDRPVVVRREPPRL